MIDRSVPLIDTARDAVRNMSDHEKAKFAVEVCLDVADPTVARPALTFVSERIVQRKRLQAIVDRHENNLLDTPKKASARRIRTKPTGECYWVNGQPHWVSPKSQEDDRAVVVNGLSDTPVKPSATPCDLKVGFYDLRSAKEKAKKIADERRYAREKELIKLIDQRIELITQGLGGDVKIARSAGIFQRFKMVIKKCENFLGNIILRKDA